jgi:hypothetical protein
MEEPGIPIPPPDHVNRKIVSDVDDPPLKVIDIDLVQELVRESHERLLDEVFRLVSSEVQAAEIAKEPGSIFLIKSKNLAIRVIAELLAGDGIFLVRSTHISKEAQDSLRLLLRRKLAGSRLPAM